jgi:hypothetical protein
MLDALAEAFLRDALSGYFACSAVTVALALAMQPRPQGRGLEQEM